MDTIFRCLAGSRLYGTHTENSDYDYKAVHLPTAREILLGNRKPVISTSTGRADARNEAGDVDTESFELQRFISLAAGMQTIPVELLFVRESRVVSFQNSPLWFELERNRDKILNRNSKAFVGYCKGQAVRYSLRGKRLETFERVLHFFDQQNGMKRDRFNLAYIRDNGQLDLPGVTFPVKEHNGKEVIYLDVFGRQVPDNLRNLDAIAIYEKPVKEAGARARAAQELGGMDLKALYHAVRIADEGISLFKTGKIHFPCQNLPFLKRIRAGEVEIDEILDVFDEKIAILEGIGDDSPLREAPDWDWINDFVAEAYEDIVVVASVR